MVLSILKNFFGGGRGRAGAEPGNAKTAPAKAAKPTKAESAARSEASVEGFVDYVVKALVDNPAGVTVKTVEQDRASSIQVFCDKSDIGKVIGKNGKTISAIRALANGAGGRLGLKVSVEVMD